MMCVIDSLFQSEYALNEKKLPNFRRYGEDMKYYLAPSRFTFNTAYVEAGYFNFDLSINSPYHESRAYHSVSGLVFRDFRRQD